MSLRSVSLAALTLAVSGGLALPAAAQTAFNKFSRTTEIAADATSVTTTHGEMTPFVPAEISNVSNLTFTLSAGETYEIVEAFTRKADGSKIAILPSDVITQTGDIGQAASFVDTKTVQVSFRGVAVGDTVVATIRIKSPKPPPLGGVEARMMLNPSQQDTEFTYTLKTPADMPIEEHFTGMNYLRTTEADGSVSRVWSGRFKPRSMIETNVADTAFVSPYMEFSTARSWEQIGAQYWTEAEPKLKVTPKVQALADSITQGVSDRREQAHKLHDWVADNIRYVAVYLGNGPWVPNVADDVIDRRYGDCKDHAGLLAALLAAKGIRSEHALVSLTDNYTALKTPMRVAFNHVVIYLPDFDVYADPTNPNTPFGMIEPALAGKFVVRSGPAGATTAHVPSGPPDNSRSDVETVLTLTPDKHMNVETTTRVTGDFAFYTRGMAASLESNGQAKFVSQLQGIMATPGTASMTFQPSTSRAEPFVVTGKVDGSSATDTLDITSFAPSSGLTQYGVSVNNLFGPKPTLPRITPLGCMPGVMKERITVRLPAGVGVKELPPAVTVDKDFASYKASWTMRGDALVIERELVSKVESRVCPAYMAPALVKFGTAVAKDQRQRISFTGWPDGTTAAADVTMDVGDIRRPVPGTAM